MRSMRQVVAGLAVAVMVLPSASCATGGAGGNGEGSSFVRMDVGVGTVGAMVEQTRDLLLRQQFTVIREEPAPAPSIETEWRNQTPLEDEQAAGVTDVQARIIVRGRERNPMGGMRVFQVTYTMQTLVKTLDSVEWIEMEVTPQRRAWAREIGRELQTLLEFARR